MYILDVIRKFIAIMTYTYGKMQIKVQIFV